MLDINNSIKNAALQHFDPEGNMYNLDHWSPLTVRQRAIVEGIDELSDAHWHVIYKLRDMYRQNGRATSTREVMQILVRDFPDEGGSRYLYELFPMGPVSQGSRLAGVPAPPNSSDPSFGWAG